MNKSFWISVGLLVALAAGLVGLRSFFKPATSENTNSASVSTNVDTSADTKLMISLESFRGFHHDAEILLEKLTILKTGLENAIITKDIGLLGSTVNNTYRIMDNVSVSRLPTIAPFKVCDEALDTLGLYAVASKTYYSDTGQINIDQIDKMRATFNTQFSRCQNIVNDKSVEALYQDYQ
ncbi:hypothetical protein ES754_04830 [Psychrobacter frigidicola]|uniref:Uncharacterized protein n=1 Tax=Psychrobacter frigidicola TaxID=45611 RepID=A0A5C7A4S7_9GAMM|nr:hypothetical protein [Psychrobacter frigidicola]TXD98262.1 hypothetical protein ES754_04830 [Psychrobacter frigidicola]